VRSAGKTFGQRNLAKASGISLSDVSAILLGKRRLTRTTLAKLYQAIPRLEMSTNEQVQEEKCIAYVIRDSEGRPSAVHRRKDTGNGKQMWWESPHGKPWI
jgi:hypothetical protein